MFMTIVKSPKVKSISGAETSFKTGLIKKFIRPNIKPIVTKVAKLSSRKVKPSTILAAI